MARTAAQNQQWWLDMAARYEKEATHAAKPAQRTDYARRAAAARAHATTYTISAPC